MIEIKTFEIKQKFIGTKDLYGFLLKNPELIEEEANIKIQKTLKYRSSCVTGKEEITERNILFFVSRREFPDDLGELIVLAGTFDIDIIVFFMTKINAKYFDSLNWLQKISNEDTQFILGEIEFYPELFFNCKAQKPKLYRL